MNRRLGEALALHREGNLAMAEILYRDVLRTSPRDAQALGMLGLIEAGRKNTAAAIDLLQRSIDAAPDNPATRFNLGLLLQQQGRLEEALACLDAALVLAPRAAQVLNARGMVLHRLARFDEAIGAYQAAIEIEPGHAEAIMNKGVALYELKRHDEAHACLVRALELAPRSLDVRVNLGNVLLELGRPDEALAKFRQVIEARPGDQDVLMNMANALRDQHRYAEAVPVYERALALDPACADVHWNMALCLLAMGEFERGWAEYEWRRRIPALHDMSRNFDAPSWTGHEPLAGKTILVHAEQGLGDTLQFCRYTRNLAALGARVVLEAQRPLMAVLETLEGVSQLVARGDALPTYDFHCPLLSLPYALRTRLETIPAAASYLRADPMLVEHWRPLLQAGNNLNIGLAWSGNAAHSSDHRRSMSLATMLAGLPQGPAYWCLQKDFSPADAALLQADGRVRKFDRSDFANTAAQAMLMDAVVSVDTSIAHLAAALGRPTLILLAHAADWRWLWPREDSPWYPGVTLLRQSRQGDWGTVLDRAALKITGLATGQR